MLVCVLREKALGAGRNGRDHGAPVQVLSPGLGWGVVVAPNTSATKEFSL